MQAALISIYTEDIKELAVITTHYNKRRYCEKHGYDLILKTKDFQIQHLGFEKLRLVHDILKEGKYDWVYWCGCDTMITNYNIRLEDLIDEDYHFIVSTDIWDINADSFLCRASDKGIQFLEHMLSLYDEYIDENGAAIDRGQRLPDGGARCWGEQEAIIDHYPNYTDVVKVEPQKVMNSYIYSIYPSAWHQKGLDSFGNNGTWSPGDFLIHFPGIPNNVRLNLAINMIKEVVGDEEHDDYV